VQSSLREYAWPGNIRELENVIERAVILSNHGTLRIDGAIAVHAGEPATDADGGAPPVADRRTMEQVERTHILNVLKQTSWRIAGDHGAGAILDMHPNTLRSRMAKARNQENGVGIILKTLVDVNAMTTVCAAKPGSPSASTLAGCGTRTPPNSAKKASMSASSRANSGAVRC
jgi:hypothetical protein